jgi:hypothetical protein
LPSSSIPIARAISRPARVASVIGSGLANDLRQAGSSLVRCDVRVRARDHPSGRRPPRSGGFTPLGQRSLGAYGIHLFVLALLRFLVGDLLRIRTDNTSRVMTSGHLVTRPGGPVARESSTWRAASAPRTPSCSGSARAPRPPRDRLRLARASAPLIALLALFVLVGCRPTFSAPTSPTGSPVPVTTAAPTFRFNANRSARS